MGHIDARDFCDCSLKDEQAADVNAGDFVLYEAD